MQTVHVSLGNNSYDILIGDGLLGQLGDKLLKRGFQGKVVVITDTIIRDLYGSLLTLSLEKYGFEVAVLAIQPGEEQKSLEAAADLYSRLCDNFVERSTPVLAFGGGVVGDLAGFVSATYLRGVPFIQVPTTLLAQVDSSIGGKVAVNHGRLKNMIGAFYQPKLVVSDVSVAKSLNENQIQDGLAEIIKSAMIKDNLFFDYLDRNIDSIRALDKVQLEKIVHRTVRIKASIVEIDERDTGVRQLLNFGHTIGHAIESASNFRISHGEAVSLGMIAAGKISIDKGVMPQSDYLRMVSLIKRAGLPYRLPDINISGLLEAINHDKKTTSGKIKFVMANTIGSAVLSQDVNLSDIERALLNWDEET